MIELSIGNAITLVVAFLGLVAAFGKILVGQFDARMSERLSAQNELRKTQIEGIESDVTEIDNMMKGFVAKLEQTTNTLPLEYVRREDWIRFSSVIDAKLDSLAKMLYQVIGEPRARG